MATPVYIIGLNSSIPGMAANANFLDSSVGTPDLSNVMIGSRADVQEPSIHPFIRGWIADAPSPGAEFMSNSDPYRKVMNYTLSYVSYTDTSVPVVLVNGYRTSRGALAGSRPTWLAPGLAPYWDLDIVGNKAALPGPSHPAYNQKPPSFMDGPTSTTTQIFLEFNNPGWNQMASAAESTVATQYTDFLDQDNEGFYDEGYPWFDEFLTGTMGPSTTWSSRLSDAGQQSDYDGIFKWAQAGLGGSPYNRWYHDHSFVYAPGMEWDGNPDEPGLLGFGELSDPVFDVVSTYNYYVDSSPDYETAISASRIPECLLPNYYMLLLSFLEGPDVVAAASTQEWSYLPQSTAGTNDTDLQDLFSNNPSLPDSVMQGYWEAIAPIIHNVPDTDIAAYETLYKNVFISHDDVYDLGVDAESTSPTLSGPGIPTVDTLPFYNTITIHSRPVSGILTGEQDNVWSATDFFKHIHTTANWRSWALGLQMLAANSYNPNLPAPAVMSDENDRALTLNGVVKKRNFDQYRPSLSMDLNFAGSAATDFAGNTVDNLSVAPVLTPLAVRAELEYLSLPYLNQGGFDPEDGDSFYGTGGRMMNGGTLSGDTTDSYVQRYNNVGHHAPGTPAAPELNYSIVKAAPAVPSSHPQLGQGDWGIHQLLSKRTLPATTDEVGRGRFQGTPGQTSPLMYVIEKRVVADGEDEADMTQEPVQRIFISLNWRPDGTQGEFVKYIDTQVKFGVRYQYDVKILSAIFGLTYQYSNFNTTHEYVMDTTYTDRPGRPLGNALGFYNEKNTYLTNLGWNLLTPDTQENWATHAGRAVAPYYVQDSNYEDADGAVNETDVGFDMGLTKANVTWDPTGDIRQFFPWAHTGYYVFGNASAPAASTTAEGTPDHNLMGAQLQEGWVKPFAASLRNEYPLHFDESTGGDGLLFSLYDGDGPAAGSSGTNIIGASPPGGYFSTNAQSYILSNLIVRVETGLNAPAPISHTGQAGNDDGGLVPVRAEIGTTRVVHVDPPPVPPCDDINGVPGLDVTFAVLADTWSAFYDWYVQGKTYRSLKFYQFAWPNGAPPMAYFVKECAGCPAQVQSQYGSNCPNDVYEMYSSQSNATAAQMPYRRNVPRWFAGKSLYIGAASIPNVNWICGLPFLAFHCLTAPGGLVPAFAPGAAIPAPGAALSAYDWSCMPGFEDTYPGPNNWGFDVLNAGLAGGPVNSAAGDCAWYPMGKYATGALNNSVAGEGNEGMPDGSNGFLYGSAPRGEPEIGAIIWWLRYGTNGNLASSGRFSIAGGKDLRPTDHSSGNAASKVIFNQFDASRGWPAGTMAELVHCAATNGFWQKPGVLGGVEGAPLTPSEWFEAPSGPGELAGVGTA